MSIVTKTDPVSRVKFFFMSDNITVNVEPSGNNGFGIAGFVLALCTIFLGWIPVFGWIIWVLGLIFSAVGISKAKKVNNGMGLSIAGLVISLITSIGLLVFASALAAFLGLS
jgi:hypothetical protein